jgi:hypothetical protein
MSRCCRYSDSNGTSMRPSAALGATRYTGQTAGSAGTAFSLATRA